MPGHPNNSCQNRVFSPAWGPRSLCHPPTQAIFRKLSESAQDFVVANGHSMPRGEVAGKRFLIRLSGRPGPVAAVLTAWPGWPAKSRMHSFISSGAEGTSFAKGKWSEKRNGRCFHLSWLGTSVGGAPAGVTQFSRASLGVRMFESATWARQTPNIDRPQGKSPRCLDAGRV